MFFVDQTGLVFEPFQPGLFGDVFVDLLSFGAGEGRRIEPFQFPVELFAVNHTCHGITLLIGWVVAVLAIPVKVA